MSTATVDGGSAPDPDETIRRTVRALRSAYNVDARALARHLGISRNSLYNRLNGSAPWLASEIVRLAEFFKCDVIDFYTGNVRIAASNAEVPTGVTWRSSADRDAVLLRFPQVRARRGKTYAQHVGRNGELTGASA